MNSNDFPTATKIAFKTITASHKLMVLDLVSNILGALRNFNTKMPSQWR